MAGVKARQFYGNRGLFMDIKNGIFAVYKPKGPSSNGLLNQIRKIAKTKKVGHAGTLDPLASGVLVVGVGKEATKQLGKMMLEQKEYLAEIKFGADSLTDDAEGEKTKVAVQKIPSISDIRTVLKGFIGRIKQVPPQYSAIKIKGQESYKLARKGQVVNLKSREVEIQKIQLLNYKWPDLKIKVLCGHGVYIRSLARDIGKKLGVGGYISELERTRVGEFTKENSLDLGIFLT